MAATRRYHGAMPAIADLIVGVKVIAVAVSDLNRANRFYKETLGLPVHVLDGQEDGYSLGGSTLMLKEDWNPRVTIEVASAVAFEQALRERGVAVSDAVQIFDGFPVGAFLDSEGNKFWFCSMA
jgi:catechol 2,3-dioxygenase-like lactoylglutathione lyase family enzyme